jgi:hypothetical protein
MQSGRIILKWFFKKYWGLDWIDLSPGYGQVAGCSECGNEPSGSTKCGEILQ